MSEPSETSAVPESGKDFSEVVSDIASRKKRAAEVRFAGAPTSDESPRDVYAAGCRAIADALAAAGFSYAKSGQTLTRKSGDLVFRISFFSSHHNIAGELVVLWINAGVASPRMKKWGKSHPNLTMKRWDRYPAALARFRKKGIPSDDDALKDYGEELAAATVLFDFPDLTAETS